jgi:PTH2 family peptidyl-tRNA hydrolase
MADRILRLYAIVRGDLLMSAGKAASQAGHAFLEAFLQSPREIQQAYQSDGHGTKIVLVAPDEASIRDLYAKASDAGLATALIIDSGHVMPPHFDGNPIVTAVGIGPAIRERVCALTEGLKLME